MSRSWLCLLLAAKNDVIFFVHYHKGKNIKSRTLFLTFVSSSIFLASCGVPTDEISTQKTSAAIQPNDRVQKVINELGLVYVEEDNGPGNTRPPYLLKIHLN